MSKRSACSLVIQDPSRYSRISCFRVLSVMMRSWLVLLLLLAGCGEDRDPPRRPVFVDASGLSPEHQEAMQWGQDAWEGATGINLFDPDGIPVTASYGEVEPGYLAHTDAFGNMTFRDSWFPVVDCDPVDLNDPTQIPRIIKWPWLAEHELGHVIGLAHNADDSSVMNPSVAGCATPSDEDVAAVLALWE